MSSRAVAACPISTALLRRDMAATLSADYRVYPCALVYCRCDNESKPARSRNNIFAAASMNPGLGESDYWSSE